MKIRNGFVSNSSSSSFVVAGKKYEREYLDSLISAKLGIEPPDEDSDSDYDIDEFQEKVADHLGACGFTYHYDSETTDVYIGLDLIDIGEDETLREFKQRIKNKLKKDLGDELSSIVLFNAVINMSGDMEY
jgi:hypothetical protein